MVSLNQVFQEFLNHPQSWTRVDTILTHAQTVAAKHVALRVLEDLISHRWNLLPKDQHKAIREFVVDNIIKLSSSEQVKMQQAPVLRKMNTVLCSVRRRAVSLSSLAAPFFPFIFRDHFYPQTFLSTQFYITHSRPNFIFAFFSLSRW
jgi:hypothetical protein